MRQAASPSAPTSENIDTVMQSIVNLLKSRGFLLAVGLILFVTLVLVLGAWLEWSMTVRLLGVIIVLVVFMVILAVSFVRANKAAGAIQQSIKMQAQQQRQNVRPDRQGEIEELERDLERAIEMLKQSKLGKRTGRGGAALYALPWYMMIGPPAAGKTTAIANSGLNFPIGTNAVRGVGGTRNCDWFFSDQAILLDTAGRYMTEHEDTEEWLAFLATLKKHRKERPINGVIVGISLAELAEAEPAEIEWHADNIRQRIDELIKHLGIRFPVYLLFTKSDLLQGFVEFFGELSRSERDQVWGTTLEKVSDPDDVQTLFEHEFDVLHERLLAARSVRLSRSMKREDRRKVYVFPLEFASAKHRLSQFVSRLFQPNPYQESPLLRGFYFTSGTQEGNPIDRVIQAIARQVNLPAVVDAEQRDPDMETKSYFIRDVFTRILVPDQYLVSQTSHSRRKGHLVRAGVSLAAAAALVLFLLGATQALLRSRLDIVNVETAAAAVAPVSWGGSMTANLERMDELAAELRTLERRERRPPWLRLGLYRGGTVLEPARRLYLDRARAFVEAYPYPALLDRLDEPAPETRLEGAAREQLHDDLKAYLLMTSEVARLEEDHNREMLRDHLLTLAAERAPILRSDSAAADVREQLDRLVAGLHAGEVQPFGADQQLVSRVRTAIFQPPSVANLYEAMKDRAMGETPTFTLADAVPPHFLSYFSNRPEVPGFFTKAGWEQHARDAIAAQSEDPERTEWVMGYQVEDLPSAMRDQQQVAQQLEQLYFNEYAGRWERFLNSVRLRLASDPASAARQLNDLGSQYDSPLVYVLAHTSEQTRFQSEEGAGYLEDRVRERAERAGEAQVRNRTGVTGAVTGRQQAEEDLHPVDQRFRRLHELNAGAASSGGAAPGLYEALQSLERVGAALEAIAANGNPHAAEYAAGVLSQNGGELAAELQAIDRAVGRLDPDVRSALFAAPVRQAWRMTVAAAQNHLNTRWREQVYEPFQDQLAQLYPFSESTQGALLMDVESYFHPQTGAVATFVEEELAPFISRDGTPRRWEGDGVTISSAAEQTREAAARIAEGLFSGGTMRVDFEMQPDLPEREGNAPAADAVFLRIHGSEDTYRMGNYRPWTSFGWPGGSGASLSLSTRQGDVDVARYQGDWALLRLLQDARIQRRSGSEYDVRWIHDYPGQGRVVLRYGLRARTAPELFSNPRGFFNIQVPETLQ